MIKPRLKKVRRSVRTLNSMLPFDVCGRRFRTPFFAGLAPAGRKRPNPWMVQLLQRLDLCGGLFVDVGANVGQSLIAMKAAYPDCIWVGYEPNSACVFYLNQLIKKNELIDAHVLPIGCSDSAALLPLWIKPKSLYASGATMMPQSKDVSDRRIDYVPVFSLSETLKVVCDHAAIDKTVELLKVDVEGHEASVLEGAMDLLCEDRPKVICEVFPPRSELDESRLETIRSLNKIINTIAYEVFHIGYTSSDLLKGVRPLSAIPEQVSRKSESGYSHDYLLLPTEHATESIHDLLFW